MSEWVPVYGWEGLYEITRDGEIRATRRAGTNGEPLKVRLNNSGYPSARLSANGKEKTTLIHRLLMATFVGPCPDGMEVNHINGDRLDFSLTNLEYVTASENLSHAYRLGRTNHVGEDRAASKLTEADVRAIRASSDSHSALARRFGVAHSTIRDVRSGRTWKHVLRGEEERSA